jgi:hypothetical protein
MAGRPMILRAEKPFHSFNSVLKSLFAKALPAQP